MINREILKIGKGLEDLQELNLKFNVRTSYKLARNKQILTPVLDLIRQKQMEIYATLGEKNDDGTITVPREKVQELQDKIDELMSLDTPIEVIKIKIEDFDDISIPFDVMERILGIIEEETA